MIDNTVGYTKRRSKAAVWQLDLIPMWLGGAPFGTTVIELATVGVGLQG